MSKFRFEGVLLIIIALVIFSCDQAKSPSQTTSKPVRRKPLEVMMGNDCFNCHGINDRVVGPPYMDIAKRYAGDQAAKDQLIKKVREGGGGLWYGGMMSAHPFIKQHDLNGVVEWVLSLDEREKDFTDNLQTPELKEQGKFAVYALVEKGTSSKEKELLGYMDQVSFVESKLLSDISQHRTLSFEGTISSNPGRHVFRLQKSGNAMLKVDDQVVIRDHENDTELVKELLDGEHSVQVVLKPASGSQTLVLSWIQPETAFFEVM